MCSSATSPRGALVTVGRSSQEVSLRIIGSHPVHEPEFPGILDQREPVGIEHRPGLVEIEVLLLDDRDVAQVVSGAVRVRVVNVEVYVAAPRLELELSLLGGKEGDVSRDAEVSLALVVDDVDPGTVLERIGMAAPPPDGRDPVEAVGYARRPAIRVQIALFLHFFALHAAPPARHVSETVPRDLHDVEELQARHPVRDARQAQCQRRIVVAPEVGGGGGRSCGNHDHHSHHQCSQPRPEGSSAAVFSFVLGHR